MTVDASCDLVRHTLFLALLIAAPMLIIGLVVGVLVSLVQAVTQIQEQTLTFVPKITAMVLAAIVLLPWIQYRMIEYAASVFQFGEVP